MVEIIFIIIAIAWGPLGWLGGRVAFLHWKKHHWDWPKREEYANRALILLGPNTF